MINDGKAESSNPERRSSAVKLPADCRLVFSNVEIEAALDDLANRLNQQLLGENPVAICVLQGGLVFAGQLIPRLDFMLEIDYIHATRYNNQTSGDELAWKAYPVTALKDRTVLIMDDILDEGITLQAIIRYCESQGARKVISTVLLKKCHQRCVESECVTKAMRDNVALTIDDHYVFGFGMDYNGQYRQLDQIYALEGSDK